MTASAALLSLRRGVLRRAGEERGAAGPVTAAIVVPTIMMLIATGIQVGLWFVARSAAMTSAEEGARAMAAQQASQGDGCAAAQSFATRAGANLFTVDEVTCTRGDMSTVTVRGRGLSMIPGMPVEVLQSASLPVEQVS